VLLSAIKHLPHAVLVCDASLPSLPILGVNIGFEVLTGYKSAEAVGRNCQFLQGSDTDPTAVLKMREAIRAQECSHVTLLNYRKNGTSFLNLLSLSPVFDADGLCRFFLGTASEVYENFSGMKPQLRHADRLHKLLPRRLLVPSCDEARARMVRTRETIMRKHPVAHMPDDESVASHRTSATSRSHNSNRTAKSTASRPVGPPGGSTVGSAAGSAAPSPRRSSIGGSMTPRLRTPTKLEPIEGPASAGKAPAPRRHSIADAGSRAISALRSINAESMPSPEAAQSPEKGPARRSADRAL